MSGTSCTPFDKLRMAAWNDKATAGAHLGHLISISLEAIYICIHFALCLAVHGQPGTSVNRPTMLANAANMN